MTSVQLIHWNSAEARECLKVLKKAGFRARYDGSVGPGLLKKLKADLPDSFVIDLSRLPSHGRDVALVLRQRKSTRHIPLVFVGGDKEKVEKIRNLLPDAEYTTWKKISAGLRNVMRNAPDKPIVPVSSLAGYSGTPLVKKLGIQPYHTVALMSQPRGFHDLLVDLPEGVMIVNRLSSTCALVIWFVQSLRELDHAISTFVDRSPESKLWVAWPKKASGVVTDLSETLIRKAGIASGLVDFKICAIDDTWSGLLFARRKGNPWA